MRNKSYKNIYTVKKKLKINMFKILEYKIRIYNII